MRFDLHITGSSLEELEATFGDISLVADAVERWAVEWLKARGWCVGKFRQWETPSAFCARLGIDNQTFIRKTRDQRASGLFEAKWGPSGRRIQEISSTPAFDAFCLRYKPKPKEPARQ